MILIFQFIGVFAKALKLTKWDFAKRLSNLVFE